MNKWFRILFLCLIIFVSVVSAEDLVPGQAYIISSINVDPSELITANQKYSLVPQVVVYDGTTEYVGSVTKFTGCYGTRRYVDGVDKGECFLGGLATASQDGLMSKEDKAKLDGINPSNYASSSHVHDDRYYTESEIDAKFGSIKVNSLPSTGYGNTSLTFYQTGESFDGNSGWTSYLIANHGDGASYYHYTIGLPFWGAPIYKRQMDNPSNTSGWHSFITSENIGSQTVNRSNSSFKSERLLINGATSEGNFHWSGQGGQPTWLWGSNDGTNMYVWNPSNFSVNYSNSSGWASSAGNADTVDGYHAGDIGKAVLLWTNSSPTSQFNAQTISVNLSGYQFVKIVFYTGGSGFYYTSDFIVQNIPQIGATTVGYNIASWNSTNTIQNVGREISGITSSGVKFGQGYFTVNTYREYNNIFGIPYKIYGIK